MKREDLISQTRRLLEEGERIDRAPSRAALNTWLAASDALLSEAWGSMDRYHLAWLEVGRIAQPLRGRARRSVATRTAVNGDRASAMTGGCGRCDASLMR